MKEIGINVYDFNIEKIHNTVWVFKNALKNSENFIKYFEEDREWKDWYTFGKVAKGADFVNRFDSFPSLDEWNAQRKSRAVQLGENDFFENQINDIFYHATKLYIEENNLLLDNWAYDGWNVAKYTSRPEEPMAMAYHTDYQREYTHNPGSKFVITCVFYLNDDYDGGEVLFRFLDDDLTTIKEDYSYRPSAGDAVVFMSGHPHYHAVKAVTEGQKYIIRTYWRYWYPGHPIWLKLEEKYGKEKWAEMEKDRVKNTRGSYATTTINDIVFYKPFEKYYEKEISELAE